MTARRYGETTERDDKPFPIFDVHGILPYPGDRVSVTKESGDILVSFNPIDSIRSAANVSTNLLSVRKATKIQAVPRRWRIRAIDFAG